MSELLLALVIAPIATELPEKFNSLIWVRQGKDTLAMGNITGAMVFQSAIPTVVALVLAGSAWHVDDDSLHRVRCRPASRSSPSRRSSARCGAAARLDGTVAARRRRCCTSSTWPSWRSRSPGVLPIG